jgi:hypothetical protein
VNTVAERFSAVRGIDLAQNRLVLSLVVTGTAAIALFPAPVAAVHELCRVYVVPAVAYSAPDAHAAAVRVVRYSLYAQHAADTILIAEINFIHALPGTNICIFVLDNP